MSYPFILNIHIISYLIWIFSFFGSMYFFFKIRNTTTGSKPDLMRKERLVSTIGGHLGFLGIFITGGIMVSLKSGPRMGWFNFAEHGWLAWKQVLFIIAIILIFAFVMPGSAKLKRAINERVDLNKIEKIWSKTFFFSLMVYVIVLINTILGINKPF